MRLNIFLDFIKCYKLTKGGHFYHFLSIRTKTQRCTPSVCVLSLCWLIAALQCMLYDIQPIHEIEYLLGFYRVLWIFHEFDSKHAFNMCFIRIRIDNNTPTCTLGGIAWTRSRIFPKLSYIFQNPVIFIFFSQIERKHDVAHLLLMFDPYVELKKTFYRVLSDIYPRNEAGQTERQTDRWKSWNLYPLLSRGINNSCECYWKAVLLRQIRTSSCSPDDKPQVNKHISCFQSKV